MCPRLTRKQNTPKRLRILVRSGMTLVELLMVTAVMGILASTMAALATTVQMANEQQLGRGEAIQHGQVAIERIERAILGAVANENFPGFIVITETDSGFAFPDTLVVWNPKGDAVDPTGMPRVSELVMFTTESGNPSKLLEIQDTSDTSEVPALDSSFEWQELVEMLRTSYFEEYGYGGAVLTNLLRTAKATSSSRSRGCIRFEQQLRPSASEWQDYKDGNTDWEDLPWALGVFGATTGQRQALCRVELQLRPGDIDSNDKGVAIPFFGSGAIYYQLER